MSTNNQCEKMENLKIRVKNRDQVLAVHGLAKCLGMVKPYNNFTLHDGYVALDFNDMHILDASIEQCGSELNPFKEITLPELRQLAGRESLNDQYAEIEKVRQSQWSKQVGGNHYKDMPIQPAQFALENKLDYCQANAIKYICRHEHKNGKEDLEKAKHYIDLLIEHYYG